MRIPNHPIARQLLTAFGGGIAAPSANRYGHVSPTRTEHVREEFGDDVPVVLEGGDSKIGLESTIVSCLGADTRLLRPGFITASQLRAVVPGLIVGADPSGPRVPGSAVRHYSPSTPLNIVPGRELAKVIQEFASTEAKVAVLGMKPPSIASPFMTWINAGNRPDLYARNLYSNLRTLDKSGARMILVEDVPEGERWDAVRDRLKRAATAENVVTYDHDVAALRADMDEDFT